MTVVTNGNPPAEECLDVERYFNKKSKLPNKHGLNAETSQKTP